MPWPGSVGLGYLAVCHRRAVAFDRSELPKFPLRELFASEADSIQRRTKNAAAVISPFRRIRVGGDRSGKCIIPLYIMSGFAGRKVRQGKGPTGEKKKRKRKTVRHLHSLTGRTWLLSGFVFGPPERRLLEY